MNLLTPKEPSGLLYKTRGVLSPQVIMEMKQREDAAITMCGGLLGNCYLLAEVVEGLMVDALAKFKEQRWYKQNIRNSKKYFKAAYNNLHSTIVTSIYNSPTNPQYMREMADAIGDILKSDIFKLRNAVLMELNRHKIENSEACADIVTIEVLLRCIGVEYDKVLEYMKTIFDTFYNSWYHQAKCAASAHLWNEGMQAFAKTFVPNDIDLNNSLTIQNGIKVIQNKMHSDEISDAAKAEASKWAEEGNGQEMYDQALEVLKLNN